MNSQYIEQYPEAIESLKRSLRILSAVDSELAAAAISMKLVDVLDSLVQKNFKQSLDDLWSCSFVIQRILYESFSEKLDKKSDKAIIAKDSAENKDYRTSALQYVAANLEITNDTGFNVLFI